MKRHFVAERHVGCAIWKLTSKLTLYTAYQVGNAGVTAGNHQFLWELGYNFN